MHIGTRLLQVHHDNTKGRIEIEKVKFCYKPGRNRDDGICISGLYRKIDGKGGRGLLSLREYGSLNIQYSGIMNWVSSTLVQVHPCCWSDRDTLHDPSIL